MDEIFTVDLTLCCSKCQIDRKNLSIFVAFLKNVNFTCFAELVKLVTASLRAVWAKQNAPYTCFCPDLPGRNRKYSCNKITTTQIQIS